MDAILIAHAALRPHADHDCRLPEGAACSGGKAGCRAGQDAQQMIDAYEAAKQQHPGLVFSAVFMQRTMASGAKSRKSSTAATWGNWNGSPGW